MWQTRNSAEILFDGCSINTKTSECRLSAIFILCLPLKIFLPLSYMNFCKFLALLIILLGRIPWLFAFKTYFGFHKC